MGGVFLPMSRRAKHAPTVIPDLAAMGRVVERYILKDAPVLGSWVTRWAAENPTAAIADTTVRQVVRGTYNAPNYLSLDLLWRFCARFAGGDEELAQLYAYDILRAGGLVPNVAELSNTVALKRMSEELHSLVLATNRHTAALKQARERRRKKQAV